MGLVNAAPFPQGGKPAPAPKPVKKPKAEPVLEEVVKEVEVAE